MDPDTDAEDLSERVEELEATVSKMLPNRRGVLKGLGAAAIGGAAVGGATGGASGQTAVGQVGTESEPVDVEAATMNAGSVNTDQATVSEQIDAGTTPWEVYVDPSGSASATGLSSSEPVPNLTEAFDRIIRVGEYNQGAESVRVIITGGSTITTSSVVAALPWVHKTRLESSDGSTVTLEVPAGDTGIFVNGTVLTFGPSISVTAADGSNPHETGIYVTNGAGVVLDGTSVDSGSRSQITGDQGGWVLANNNASISSNGAGTGDGVRVREGAHIDIGSSVTVSDCADGVFCDRGATADVNASIDNCENGARAQDGAAIKFAIGDLTNCTVGVLAEDHAVAKILGLNDLTTTGTSTSKLAEKGGTIVDQQNDITEKGVGDNWMDFVDQNNNKLFRVLAGVNYSPANVTTSRSFDANNTTVSELADVLGTFLQDTQRT